MRKFIQSMSNSDPWLSILVFGSIGIAIVCAFYAGEAADIPEDKTIVTMVRGGTDRDRRETRQLVEGFKQTNDDVHLNIITSNVQRKADTMIAAGVAPDLHFVPCDQADYYISADVLVDLVPFIRQDPDLMADFGETLFTKEELIAACGPELYADGPPQPDFVEALVKPFRRRGPDGQWQLFAIPVNYNPFIVFYSKDLFDRYSIPYPTANWDWEELRRKAIALTRDKAGRRSDHPDFDRTQVESYGFQFAHWQHGVECFIRQNGGRLVNEAGDKVVANDPRTVEALQFLYDLKFKDHVVPPGAGVTSQNIGFTKGTLGMLMYGVFYVPTVNSSAPELDWDVAPLPRKVGGPDGGRASVAFPNGWGITRDSEEPESAWKWLKYLSSEAGMAVADRPVFLPSRRSVLRQRGDVALEQKPASRWAMTHDVDNGYAEAPYSTKQYYGAVYEIINDTFFKLLQTSKPPFTPQEAAELMTKQGNIALERDVMVRGSTRFGYVALGVALVPFAYGIYRLLTRRKKGLSPLALSEERWGYALISPWMVGFVAFWAFPIIVSILLSFSRWQSLSDFTEAHFVGFENYETALSGRDPKFYTSLWVTFRYALLAVPLTLFFGLALAILMNQAVKGITVFRTLYYLPAVLPSVASAVLWWHLFNTNHGWVNRVLGGVNEWSTLQLLGIPVAVLVVLGLSKLLKSEDRQASLLRGGYVLPALLGGVLVGAAWITGFSPEWQYIQDYVHTVGERAAALRAQAVEYATSQTDDPFIFSQLVSERVNEQLTGDYRWLVGEGVVQHFAEAVTNNYPINWLWDEHVTPYIFVVIAIWGVGAGMIIYLAGLQGIPTQLYEAAEIDGATRWQRLRNVTLPMLTPVIFFNLIMGVIASFQVFNLAFVLFDGATGPNDSALFYGLHLFREAFMQYRLGYASALAWILFVIVLVFTIAIFKSSPMWVHYEAAKGKRA
jgi:ABC-type sugar transport system permease subunit/ABC-type glycerol-3-phosphate transport system substrate-binding protein